MLKLNNINVYYGVSHVLKDISLHVEKGEIISIIGANGAGKTTLLKTISGLLSPKNGQIIYQNQEIQGMRADKIVRQKIVCVPEGRRIFKDMSVSENILLGAYTVNDHHRVQKRYQEMLELFPILKDREQQLAGNLSGGEQQMLAMARALMSEPQVLLLDEPSMGLAPKMVGAIFALIKTINQQGTTVLLIEQNAKMALNISSRAYIFETGSIVLEGFSADLVNSPDVQKIYLGG